MKQAQSSSSSSDSSSSSSSDTSSSESSKVRRVPGTKSKTVKLHRKVVGHKRRGHKRNGDYAIHEEAGVSSFAMGNPAEEEAPRREEEEKAVVPVLDSLTNEVSEETKSETVTESAVAEGTEEEHGAEAQNGDHPGAEGEVKVAPEAHMEEERVEISVDSNEEAANTPDEAAKAESLDGVESGKSSPDEQEDNLLEVEKPDLPEGNAVAEIVEAPQSNDIEERGNSPRALEVAAERDGMDEESEKREGVEEVGSSIAGKETQSENPGCVEERVEVGRGSQVEEQTLKSEPPSSEVETRGDQNGQPLKRALKHGGTPSPPKRDRETSSVYKIVKALEGLQVGEKCVHGEIDHGLCHQRKVDRRASSPSPSSASKVPRETQEDHGLGSPPAMSNGNSQREYGASHHTKSFSEEIAPLEKERSPVEKEGVAAEETTAEVTPDVKDVTGGDESSGIEDTVEVRDGEKREAEKEMVAPEGTTAEVIPDVKDVTGGDEISGIEDTVEVRDGEKREVNNDMTFSQHDFQSGLTNTHTLSSTIETYTDTVVFRREDGFLLHGGDGMNPTPHALREIFDHDEAQGSTHPRLKIIHEFPAERNEGGEQHGASTSAAAAAEVEGESEVERILRLQETHDLVCPVCNSCITKRVILRKRKRTTVISSDKWEREVVDEEENVESNVVEEEYEDWGCLACFTFLFRRVRGARRTQVIEAPGAPEANVAPVAPQVITEPLVIKPPGEVLDMPLTPKDERADGNCLPLFFTWRRKTTSHTDSDVVTPLLDKEEQEEPVSEDPMVAELEEPQAPEIQEHVGTPAAPEEVQIPVVVVESREDRICFPFSWRKATKTTQFSPEIVEPLLVKEDKKLQTEDFTRIQDELWFQEDDVAISVAPQEPPAVISPSVTTDTSEVVAEPATSTVVVTTTESERKADCNCLPAFSWGSSGRTLTQTEGPQVSKIPEVPEVTFESVPSTSVEWSRVGQYMSKDFKGVPRHVVFKNAIQPQPELESSYEGAVLTESTTEEEEALPVIKLPGVVDKKEISMMQSEDSNCLPLLIMPTLSWRRRQAMKSDEKPEEKEKPSTESETVADTSWEETVEKDEKVADREISRSQNADLRQKYHDIHTELTDEEDEPLVRKPPAQKQWIPSEVEPLPAEVEEQQTSVTVETEDSSLPDTHQPYDSFSWDSLQAEQLSTTHPVVSEIEEEGPPPSKPVVQAEKREGIKAGYGGIYYREEMREMGSWDCCLPIYSRRTSRSVEGESPAEKEVPTEAGDSPANMEKGRDHHEVVERETTIEARVTTQTTTYQTSSDPADEKHADRVDSVQVDTAVSYVQASVQHDQDVIQGTLVVDDTPTFSVQPVASPTSNLIGNKEPKMPMLSQKSTGYAEYDAFPERNDHKASELINKRLHDMEQEEISPDNMPGLIESSIEDPEPVPPPERTDEELDASSCRCFPLSASYSMWPWSATAEDAQLREPLLPSSEQSGTDSKDSSVHMTLQQVHQVTETKTDSAPSADEVGDDATCSCLPGRWSGRRGDSSVTGTTVTVTTDETIVEVEGGDAASTLEAVRDAIEEAGMMDEPPPLLEYLKSIVYGGLDVSLTSLGVVASGAGGDAKTRNVLALGLANLVFGFIAFFYKIQDLHTENPVRFRESVGPSFWANGSLAILSFLVFGSLPALTFGFCFRQSNDHDYKMAATVLVSVIAIAFLGCGKVAAKMTELSYRRTVSTLILTGVAAAVAGFYAGEYISKLLEKYGIVTD